MSLRVFPCKTINYAPFGQMMYHFQSSPDLVAYPFYALPFTDSDGNAFTETVLGHISTSKTYLSQTELLRHQHNCDHLQLSGDIVDPSFMTLDKNLCWLGPNSYKLVEGKVKDDNLRYQVAMVVVGSNILRQCVVCAITSPGYYRRSFVRYMRWFQKGNLWYMYQTEVQPVFTSSQDVLAMLPTIYDYLEQPEFGSLQMSQPDSPIFTITSSVSYSDVVKKYQPNSFDWYELVANRSEVSSEAYINRMFEQHYYALAKIPELNENGFAFTKDVKNFLEDCKALYSTIKGKPSPKQLADLFLSLKYGPPQTLSDVRKVFSTLSHAKKNRSGVSAMDSFGYELGSLIIETTIRYHARPDLNDFEKIGKLLRYLDADITFANIWELVPFSFVVDWFTGIDDSLTRRELKSTLEYYDIDAVFDTVIYEASIPASSVQSRYIGMIGFRHYLRNCSADAYFPLVAPKEPSPTSHWLEGLALIIQRLF